MSGTEREGETGSYDASLSSPVRRCPGLLTALLLVGLLLPACAAAQAPLAQAVVEVSTALGVVGSWQFGNPSDPADVDFGSTPTLFTGPGGTPNPLKERHCHDSR